AEARRDQRRRRQSRRAAGDRGAQRPGARGAADVDVLHGAPVRRGRGARGGARVPGAHRLAPAAAQARGVSVRAGLASALGFVRPWLAGRRRVLEVGCGRGDLAAALGRDGHEVTAIDRRLERPEPGPTYIETDFLAYDARGFDAVVLVA